MPDLSGLTDEQRAALSEQKSLADMYRDAVERRVAAQEAERQALVRLLSEGYRIAGVKTT